MYMTTVNLNLQPNTPSLSFRVQIPDELPLVINCFNGLSRGSIIYGEGAVGRSGRF